MVSELTDSLSRSSLTIVTDYRGLTVAQLQDLRGQLKQGDAEFTVAKNTLTRIAARATEREAIEPALEGPTALVFTYGDIAKTAKTVNDFVRTSRILQIRAALFEGSLLAPEQVEEIANLPSREELVAKVVGGLSSPLYGIVGVLSGPMRSLMYVLQARADQLEQAA
jgi:large subunit ribosomal protein L10